MKKIIIPLLLITIVATAVLIIKFVKPSNTNNDETEEITPTVALPTISEDVSVKLNPRSDKRAVDLIIERIPQGVESIEYELTYNTSANLPRGVLGKITVDQNESEISRKDIVLGTCSSGKCAYDEGVVSIDLSLKSNFSDKSSVFQKSFDL